MIGRLFGFPEMAHIGNLISTATTVRYLIVILDLGFIILPFFSIPLGSFILKHILSYSIICHILLILLLVYLLLFKYFALNIKSSSSGHLKSFPIRLNTLHLLLLMI